MYLIDEHQMYEFFQLHLIGKSLNYEEIKCILIAQRIKRSSMCAQCDCHSSKITIQRLWERIPLTQTLELTSGFMLQAALNQDIN